MKYLLVLILLASSLLTSGQKKKNYKLANKGFMPVQINGKTLYVAETETTTAQWVEFVREYSSNGNLAPEDSSLVLNPFNRCVGELFTNKRAFYRDTTWRDTKGRQILSQVACSRLPITGITYEQALRYCEYLSSRDKQFQYRLATPEEMTAIQQQSKFPDKEMASGINEHGCLLLNYRHNSWCDSNITLKQEYGYGVPMPVMTFFPSNVGLWDVFGNVAEMTSEKGVAMGGSCKDVIADCQPGARNNYDGPAYWLGFRVVAELRM